MATTVDTTITQDKLDLFKQQYPATIDQEAAIQALTLEQVQQNTADKTFDLTAFLSLHPPMATGPSNFSQCELAVATVLIGVVGFVMGIGDLGSTASGATEEVAEIAAESVGDFDKWIATLGDDTASAADKFDAVMDIIKALYDGALIGAIFAAILKHLSWWDIIYYGILGIATVVAVCATDGVAIVAKAVLMIEGGCALIVDAGKAVNICAMPPAPPPTPPGPTPPRPLPPPPTDTWWGLQTSGGFFITTVGGGGMGGDMAALNSDRLVIGPWEKFTFEAQPDNQSYAIKCCNGQYLTANGGGGIGGPGGLTRPFETNRKAIGNDEQLQLVPQPDGTVAIRTCSGTFITAVNGGGWPTPGNNEPFRTDTTTVGPWETFKLIRSFYGGG